MHENPREILNIGLGGGLTLAAVEAHEIESVDVVELDPVVVEANRRVMYQHNGRALSHPKANVIVGDGRKYVANTDKRYDVILSEPPELWIGGVSSLFTVEFYEAARRALRDGGLLCQWFPRYEMPDADYKILLNTVRTSFPYVYEYDLLPVTGLEEFPEMILLASTYELDRQDVIERKRFRLATENVEQSSYLLRMLDLATATLARDSSELEAFVGDVETVNTDDHPVLEFRGLRNRFRKFKIDE